MLSSLFFNVPTSIIWAIHWCYINFSILCKIGLWTKVPILSVKQGKYWVRAQVDGAESPLEADAELGYVAPLIEIKT